MNDLSDLQSQFVTTRAPRVSVVVPVRDAVDDLADRIAEIAVEAEFAHLNLCELILVDDGSRDLTWAVLLSLVRHEPRLRPIRLRSRFGPEAARETGVLAATGDIIVTLEPDTSVSELGQLAGLIEAEHDMVTACSGRPGLTRRVKRQLGGTAAYRREVLTALMNEGLPLAALPLAARRRGYRVCEAPMAPGRAPALSAAIALLGVAPSVFASEHLVGIGLLAGIVSMVGALPLGMLAGDVPGVGLFLAGLQIMGVSVLGSIVLGCGNRRGRAQSRIAETLLGHGARD